MSKTRIRQDEVVEAGLLLLGHLGGEELQVAKTTGRLVHQPRGSRRHEAWPHSVGRPRILKLRELVLGDVGQRPIVHIGRGFESVEERSSV